MFINHLNAHPCISVAHTIEITSDFGTNQAHVALTCAPSAPGHARLALAARQADLAFTTPLTDWWAQTPYLWERGPYEAHVTGQSRMLLKISAKRIVSNVTIEFPYSPQNGVAQTIFRRTSVMLKNNSDVTRLFMLLPHFKGPFFGWETIDKTGKSTQFRSGDHPGDIALANRLSRAFRDTIRGNPKLETGLRSCVKPHQLSDVDRTTAQALFDTLEA